MSSETHEAYLRELADGPLQVLLPPSIAHPLWCAAQGPTHLVALQTSGPEGRVIAHEDWPPLVHKLFEPFEDSLEVDRRHLVHWLGHVPADPCPYCSGTGEAGAGPLARAALVREGVLVDRHLLARVLACFESPTVAVEADPAVPTAPLRLSGSNGRELALVARLRGSRAHLVPFYVPGPAPAPEPGRKRQRDNPVAALGELRCPDCESRNFHRGICYACGFES